MKTKEEITRRLSISEISSMYRSSSSCTKLDEIYKIAKPALDNFYNYGLRESEVITREKRLNILDNICQALKAI